MHLPNPYASTIAEPAAPTGDLRHAGRVLLLILAAHAVLTSVTSIGAHLRITEGPILIFGLLAIVIPLGIGYAVAVGRRGALWLLAGLFLYWAFVETAVPLINWMQFGPRWFRGPRLWIAVARWLVLFSFYSFAGLWLIGNRRILCESK